MKRLLIALGVLLWSIPALSDAPKGMVRQIIPLPAMCLPATAAENHFAVLVGALISDYGVNISLTFSATSDPNGKRIAIIENPHSGLAGVLMITNKQTCIAFSGEDRKVFIRPLDHPMGNINKDHQI